MDPNYRVEASRDVCQLVSGAQSAHGARFGTAVYSDDGGVQRPIKSPDHWVRGVRTGDRDRNSCDCREQELARRGADKRTARAAVDSRAAQRRVRLRKKRNQTRHTDQFRS